MVQTLYVGNEDDGNKLNYEINKMLNSFELRDKEIIDIKITSYLIGLAPYHSAWIVYK